MFYSHVKILEWGDLGVEPLALRRAKSKVVWYSKLLGKDKNSYCRQIFDKEWGKCNTVKICMLN